MSALYKLIKIKDADRTSLQKAVIAYDNSTEAAAELASLQARIEKLEAGIGKALEWLNHYPSPDGIEEQMQHNVRRAEKALESALTETGKAEQCQHETSIMLSDGVHRCTWVCGKVYFTVLEGITTREVSAEEFYKVEQ